MSNYKKLSLQEASRLQVMCQSNANGVFNEMDKYIAGALMRIADSMEKIERHLFLCTEDGKEEWRRTKDLLEEDMRMGHAMEYAAKALIGVQRDVRQYISGLNSTAVEVALAEFAPFEPLTSQTVRKVLNCNPEKSVNGFGWHKRMALESLEKALIEHEKVTA